MQKVEGEVFAFDKGKNLVTIKQPGSVPNRHNLQFLKISFIKVVPPTPSRSHLDS